MTVVEGGHSYYQRELCMPANKRGRDSGNGQFIPVQEAKKNPKTTTVETIPKPEKSKKK
jgi:hypothetical protein